MQAEGTMGSGTRTRTDLAVLLALAVVLVLPVVEQYRPYTFLHGDGAFYANMNRTIRDSLGLAQDAIHPRSWIEREMGWNHELDQGWVNVSLGRDEVTWWPKHPFLMPIVSTPFFVVFGMTGLLAFNVLQTLLLLFFAYRLAARYAPPGSAAVAVLVMALTPVIQRGAYSYSNDLFYGMLVVAALEALAGRWWKTGGALLGLAVWAKLTNMLVAAPVGLWLMVRPPVEALAAEASLRARRWARWRPFTLYAAAFAVPAGVFALANAWMFGAPWVTSYDRILVRQGGRVLLESARERFGHGLKDGFRFLLFDGGEGLWKNAAPFFVALLGLVPLLRRATWLALVTLASLAGYAVLFSRYEYVYARFFLPWAGIGVVLAAVLLDALAGLGQRAGGALRGVLATPRARRWALGAAVALGVVVVLGAWVLHALRDGDERRLAARVERAAVFLGDVPCDYFNNNAAKWECSHLDRQAAEYPGRALGSECRRDGFDGEALWLHPSPTMRLRRLVFADLPPTGRLVVTAWAAGRAVTAARPVRLELAVAGGAPEVVEVRGPAPETREIATPAIEGGGGDIEIRVPGDRGGERGVCLDVELREER